MKYKNSFEESEERLQQEELEVIQAWRKATPAKVRFLSSPVAVPSPTLPNPNALSKLWESGNVTEWGRQVGERDRETDKQAGRDRGTGWPLAGPPDLAS